MISQQLLDILVCPETKQKLMLLGERELGEINNKIKSKTVKNRGGKVVTEPISGGLQRVDGKFIYPIRGNIPVMLIEESFPPAADSQ